MEGYFILQEKSDYLSVYDYDMKMVSKLPLSTPGGESQGDALKACIEIDDSGDILYLAFDNQTIQIYDTQDCAVTKTFTLDANINKMIKLGARYVMCVGDAGLIILIDKQDSKIIKEYNFEEIDFDLSDIQRTLRDDKREYMISSDGGIFFFTVKKEDGELILEIVNECYGRDRRIRACTEGFKNQIIYASHDSENLTIVDRISK